MEKDPSRCTSQKNKGVLCPPGSVLGPRGLCCPGLFSFLSASLGHIKPGHIMGPSENGSGSGLAECG